MGNIIIYANNKIFHVNKFYLQNCHNIFSNSSLSIIQFKFQTLASLSLSLVLWVSDPFSLSFLSHHLLQFGGVANQDKEIVEPKLKSWDLWWWKCGPVEVKNELWSWRHCLQSGRTFSLVLRKFREFALWDFCGGIRTLASTMPCKMSF